MTYRSFDQHLCEALKINDVNDNPDVMLPFDLAQALIRAVKQAAVTEDHYWDIHQLSEYLGVSPRSVQRHFINDPRWPKPISYGNPAKCSKRWLASECRKALLLFRCG